MIVLLAHGDSLITLADAWMSWHFFHPLTILLMIMAWWYQRGVIRLWQRAGREHGIQSYQVALFYTALLTLFIALQSPIEVLAEMFFAVHMLQHMLLLFIVAPFIVLSGTPIALLWALPRPHARHIAQQFQQFSILRKIWSFMTDLPVATALFILIFWLWHHPLLYELALASELVHIIEHSSFILSGIIFWWALLRPNHLSVPYARNVLILFITALQGTLLGVLMVFSKQAWYEPYLLTGEAYQFNALLDQQLAGAIMWLPGGFIYTLLAAFYFMKWMDQLDQPSYLVGRSR